MNIIVTTMTLSGPSQIIIRLLLLKNTKKFSMRTICITSMLFQFFAVLILSILSQEFWLLVSFTILYGLGTGMATIVGILASLEFFGASNYNLIQGALHIPATIARAAAPILIASILAVTGGYRPIILLFLIITGISSLVFIFLTNSKQISPCKMTSSES
jgi:MFS family permease